MSIIKVNKKQSLKILIPPRPPQYQQIQETTNYNHLKLFIKKLEHTHVYVIFAM